MGFYFGPRPESYVLPDERRVFRARPHIASMAKHTAIATVLILGLWLMMEATSAAGGALWMMTTVLWYAQLGVLGWLAYRTLHWWDDHLMLTDKRIMRVTGVFTSKMEDMPISKVTDRTIQHSFMGILLHYNYMRLETAGQKQSLEHIPYIPHPHALYEAVTKIVVGKDDLPPPRGRGKAFGYWSGTHSTDDISDEWEGKSDDD